MVSSIDLSYIAGILDGEGTIIVQKNRQLVVQITQNDKDLLLFIQNLLGGSISGTTRKTGNVQYMLGWCSVNAQAVLRELLNYLHLRKSKARLGILYQDMLNSRNHNGKYTDDELEAIGMFRESISSA